MKIKSLAILLCGIALTAGAAVSGGLIYDYYSSQEAKAASATWSYVNVKDGLKIVKGANTYDEVSFTMATTGTDATVGAWNTGYLGYQIGTSKNKPGTITFTFGNPWGGSGKYASYTKITSVTFEGNAGQTGGSGITATIGGSAATANPTTIARNTSGPATNVTITPGSTDTGAIVISVASPDAAFYFKSMTIVAEDATPAKALTNLSVSGTLAKTSYYTGDSFDSTGLTITATYDDASTAAVTSECSFTPSPLTEGTTSVTASYTEGGVTKTAIINGITVTSRSVASIAVLTNPTKMSYSIGQSFNPAGMKIRATYNMGPTNDDYLAYTYSPTSAFDSLGTKTITITSTDNASATTTLDINVVELVEGTYTIKSGTENYNANPTIASLSITKTDSNMGDITLGTLNNFRVGSGNTAVKTKLSFGGNETTPGSATFVLPEGFYATSVKLSGISRAADTSTPVPTLSINGSLVYEYSASITEITSKFYANSIIIASNNARIWVNEIEIIAKNANNAALDYGTHFLASTSTECVASNVSFATWANLQSIYTNADTAIKDLIKVAVANQSGTDLEHAIARYGVMLKNMATLIF